MICYIVTFEVALPNQLNALYEKLKTFGNYCPVHKNCWAIVTEKKAAEIRDYLTPVIAPADRLFVIRSGTEAAWRNSYGEKHDEWLKSKL